MELGKFVESLQALEGGEELAKQLTPHIEEFDSIKEKLRSQESIVSALGDRDVGKVIGVYDMVVKEGLDTPEKVTDIKSKAEGLELTVTEKENRINELTTEINKGQETVDEALKEAKRKELLADIKTELLDHAGDKKGFTMAVNDMLDKGLFYRTEDNKILYGKEGERKALTEAVELMRSDYSFAFKEKPSGTNHVPEPTNNKKLNVSAGGDRWNDVVSEMN